MLSNMALSVMFTSYHAKQILVLLFGDLWYDVDQTLVTTSKTKKNHPLDVRSNSSGSILPDKYTHVPD